MSVIQKIRDKYARVAVVAIALALLGFIAMDAFTGRSNLFGGGPSNNIGSVNGENIKIANFRSMVGIAEENMKQQGYPSGEATTQAAIDNVWESEVNRILMEQEMEKLGIVLSNKERDDLLYGPNPSPIAVQYLANPQAPYNPNEVRQTIRQITKSGTPEQKDQLEQLLKYMYQTRLSEKFTALITNSINYPKWMVEAQNADNSQIASISFARKPYSDIPDSSVKVSDQEINDYISKRKKEFEQKDSRSISYVLFSAAPSARDSAEVIQRMNGLKEQLANAKDLKLWLASEGETNYYDSYIGGGRIQIAQKDSIFRTPVGGIYGPYVDGNNYTIAKMVGVKNLPDTVKIRHILVATQQQDQQGNMQIVRDTATAFRIADSIRTAINNGSNFDSLVVLLSDDGGSKEKGGVYDKVPTGQMVEAFNDYIFGNPVGSKGVVKTEFGYHYIEILSQKGNSPAYKIAYLRKPITASQATNNEANNKAHEFAGKAKDEKGFNAVYEKELRPLGLNKGLVSDIPKNGYQLQGIGVSRALVRAIYEADKGEVINPTRVDDSYVVAVVTEVNEEGTATAAKARLVVEPVLRNKKKAELIKKQIGTISTLEAAATALNVQITNADSIRITGAQPPVLGFEPKVIGAAFNPANRNKVVNEAIEGSSGVFVVRVNNVSATSAPANVEEQRKALYEQGKMQAGGALNLVIGALKEVSKVKDNRLKHYN